MTLIPSFVTRHPYFKRIPALTPISMIGLTTIFILCAYNATFWVKAVDIFAGHPVSMLGYILAVYFLLLAAFSPFGYPWVVKFFLIFIVILSAITSYYMDSLGVIIDRDMIQNVMVTTITESKHLITFSFVSHVGIFGILPALVIVCVRVKRQGPIRTIAMPVLTFVVSLAMAAGLLMADLKSYSTILRERKDFMSSFQPGAPLVGAIRYAKMMTRSSSGVVQVIGDDALKGPAYTPDGKPMLAIIVAGETARSQNFSLNGYSVETNPKLAKLPVISFSDVESCGTATAVSLPCMFSKFTRDEYSYEKGVSHQNVLDVLSHAGLHVEWWDNNTGDKNLADRLPSRTFTNTESEEFCAAGECMDGVFMQALKDYADSITQDTVLVLHQIGSHGPTYYLRYPQEFERFTPACNTAEFKNCTAQEVTNAYDNTIAYTDEILAQTIAFLQSQDRLTTSLLYISDHGESLGERGLYLHGSPYFMAPEQQTKVPMILWMSQSFQNRFGFDQNCLADMKNASLSHDNLFHSLLGMLDIKTNERNPALDIFASCKTIEKVALN
jgi:lipid A ethanolaminephosphotransferase